MPIYNYRVDTPIRNISGVRRGLNEERERQKRETAKRMEEIKLAREKRKAIEKTSRSYKLTNDLRELTTFDPQKSYSSKDAISKVLDERMTKPYTGNKSQPMYGKEYLEPPTKSVTGHLQYGYTKSDRYQADIVNEFKTTTGGYHPSDMKIRQIEGSKDINETATKMKNMNFLDKLRLAKLDYISLYDKPKTVYQIKGEKYIDPNKSARIDNYLDETVKLNIIGEDKASGRLYYLDHNGDFAGIDKDRILDKQKLSKQDLLEMKLNKVKNDSEILKVADGTPNFEKVAYNVAHSFNNTVLFKEEQPQKAFQTGNK